eukprot:Partr_v1_DN27495_c2_g1_i1_m71663 putative solute carrier family 25 (mitochondrial carrier)
MVGAMMENAVMFMAFSRISNLLKQALETQTLTLPQTCLVGALSGTCASVVLTPAELIKCRVQVANMQRGIYNKSLSTGSSPAVKRTSTLQTLISVLRTDGIVGLFRGLSSTMIRETGGGALWFGSYELMCRVQLNGLSYLSVSHSATETFADRSKLLPWQVMLSGSTAGLIFNASLYPIDVIKSIEQTSKSSALTSKLSIARDIYARSGFRGFYTGLGVTVVRAVPANAMIFLVFEMASRKWDAVFRACN